MSRAAWAFMLFAGGASGLVFFLFTRGLDEAVTQQHVEVVEAISKAEAELLDAEKALDSVIAKDPEFLSKRPEITLARKSLTERETFIKTIKARLKSDVDPLIEANKHSDSETLASTLNELRTSIAGPNVPHPSPAEQAQHLLSYKTEKEQYIEAAKTQFAVTKAAMENSELSTEIAKLTTDCPNLSDKLRERYQRVVAAQQKTIDAGLQLNTLLGSDDPVKIGRQAELVDSLGKNANSAAKSFRADMLIAQRSEDHILIDMRESPPAHKYRKIIDGVSTKTDWIPVTPADFKKHEPNLGMTIYSKPACTLPEDANRLAAPPGYNYVGNERYGQWEDRGGSRVWVFYGRYALMRDLFWGPGRYRPVRRAYYDSWRTNYRAGRPWYGPTKQYGTRGSATRARYSGNHYYKKQVSRRIRPSGRTSYSGSKYSGGTTRSGGYKSSRYRSRSMGGFGK